MRPATRPDTHLQPVEFKRPEHGPVFAPDCDFEHLLCQGQVAWQSNGGPHRGHPARALPYSFEAALVDIAGVPTHLSLIGVFALFADRAAEGAGTLGATVHLLDDRGNVVFRQDLAHGRHYNDATELDPIFRANGDGTSVETVGETQIGGVRARVDQITIDLPAEIEAEKLLFKDLGSPASFVVFDTFIRYERVKGCPFRSHSGGVALSELASIIRVGDRVRFNKALDQLEESIEVATDLDEARGQALTFLAIVTAATLERGGSRAMHRVQLEAARALDDVDSLQAIARESRQRVEEIAEPLFKIQEGPSTHLVDRALAIVERNYAKNLTDATVAAQLGLSTSHFRFLFRQATGHPFHKYVVAVRLEKAKQMLLDQDLSVSEVASLVGFTGLSHFSRAFAQRFSVSPTHVRRAAS